MVRYICRVLCTVNSMHVICTGACNPSCIQSVHIRSMQWTPLLVQSKRVSTLNEIWATTKSAGLGRTGTGTSACDHTYPACYAARRTCCSNAALVGGMFSIVREPRANKSFHYPLDEHVLLYTTTRNLSIPSRVSGLTSTGCRYRSRKASIADGQYIQANHADFLRWPRQLDTMSHPLTALKSIYAFSLTFLTISWIAICRKWVPTPNLTQSSSSRSARVCPIARTTTSLSTVRITNLRSPCRAKCATWCRMRVYASSWEHGWRYSTSLTSFCVETIVSSFVLMITFRPVSHACMQSDR